MESIFKSVGKGLLYLLVLPLFLLVISCYAIVGLIMFVYLFFKSIILFFSGRSLDIELSEDKKAKQIIQNAIPNSTNSVIKQDGSPKNVNSQDIVIDVTTTNFSHFEKPASVEEACFEIKEDKKKPAVIEAIDATPTLEIEHQQQNNKIEQTNKVDNKINSHTEEDISLGKYSPKKTRFDIDDETEEKNHKEDSGVDINFKDF